ncbi:hypothetical protein ACWDF1_27205 [Streptomyces coelicoflavus]|uniref:Uncharacterized protein n=1 Tax=Streptomyces coelicoflavus TaxID=285562 RepID=A0A6N9UHW5_9ACTN|nr:MULTISPECIES: hypothetical protein [Streptomyces]EHN75953.1 hypothetical protein SMCF_4565 [Streptomyces coelicoflavus ZG0656]MZE41770.1 hypothetical protein [Streptomyces sp. SID5477]NEB08594.1 hypothetical protein [Streptomyces coelicoflavus]NEB17175.1 hypothetical protein [Streptomyces coelicoflavus]
MQDVKHVTPNDEKSPAVTTDLEGQTELIEIRLLDKIETIDSKAISR